MTQVGRWLAVLGLSVIAAVVYGISHDLVTAHLCVEYFTIGHPPIFGTEDPLLLALGWGVIATWWMGVLLGIPLACVATLGRRQPFPFHSTKRLVAWLLLTMAIGSAIAGSIGFVLATNDIIHLRPVLAHKVPIDRHTLFLTDAYAHGAAYGIALIGGVKICSLVWKRRGQMLSQPGNDSCP
jgi:hypothetical protein